MSRRVIGENSPAPLPMPTAAVPQLLAADSLVEGTYRLVFDTASFFKSCNVAGLYPRVTVEFQVRDAKAHYHIPLLLSPYGYSTYRGS